MVHVIKFYYQEQKEQQIRRLAVNSDVVGKFNLLARKIKEIFPSLADKTFEVTWRDSENDVIYMSSDEELAQALANTEDGLLRIYILTSNSPSVKPKEAPKAMSSHNEVHPGVVCDACDKNISGYRYKCLQCRNFDLCSACNAADKHAEHDMIKLVKPSYISREWVFLGARKMWKSMFGPCFTRRSFDHGFSGHCPFTQGSQEKKSEDKTPPQWQKVLSDLMSGDYVAGEKIIKNNLGNFMNFVNQFADFDIKVERPTCPNSKSDCATQNSDSSKGMNEDPLSQPGTSGLSSKASSPSHEKEYDEEINKLLKDTAVPETPAPEKAEEKSNVNDYVKLVDLETSVTGVNNVTESEVKECSPQPCGLFNECETSVSAEGWTIVNGQDEEKKETEVASTSLKNEVRAEAMYPDISESLKSCVTPQAEQGACVVAAAETRPKEPVAFTQDPEILNALDKMNAMGFTNEGGWLERLLITKNGNINAALDSLYPNTRRH